MKRAERDRKGGGKKEASTKISFSGLPGVQKTNNYLFRKEGAARRFVLGVFLRRILSEGNSCIRETTTRVLCQKKNNCTKPNVYLSTPCPKHRIRIGAKVPKKKEQGQGLERRRRSKQTRM